MVSFTKAAISSAALLALIQFSPAPFLAIPVVVSIELGSAAAWVSAAGGVAGAVAGAVAAGKAHKRDDLTFAAPFNSRVTRSQMKRQDADLPEMNQLAWQLCKTDVQSATLSFTDAGTSNVLVSGLPATCMTLVTVITGTFNEGNPVPMGTDSVQFNNVSDDIINEIQTALDARGAA